MKEGYETLREWIHHYQRIVFFGGAGVSTESGVPDFRSTNGLYYQEYRFPPEEILSHTFYRENPEEFFRFYRSKLLLPGVQPNEAHLALARLEAQGKLLAVVTQNIDGLHQLAGSKNVLELHGSVHRNTCERCGKTYTMEEILPMDLVPVCSCGGRIKPDVVLYEEGLDPEVIKKTVEVIGKADLLIVGGTSLVVYPAAGFLDYFQGEKLVVINRDATGRDASADLVLRDPIGEVLGAVIK